MQHMKEMLDTGFQRQKKGHEEAVEAARKASLTKEEREEEERLEEEARMYAEQSRSKLTDLNEEKKYTIDSTRQPHERSFLIQPEKKSLKTRIP